MLFGRKYAEQRNKKRLPEFGQPISLEHMYIYTLLSIALACVTLTIRIHRIELQRLGIGVVSCSRFQTALGALFA